MEESAHSTDEKAVAQHEEVICLTLHRGGGGANASPLDRVPLPKGSEVFVCVCSPRWQTGGGVSDVIDRQTDRQSP